MHARYSSWGESVARATVSSRRSSPSACHRELADTSGRLPNRALDGGRFRTWGILAPTDVLLSYAGRIPSRMPRPCLRPQRQALDSVLASREPQPAPTPSPLPARNDSGCLQRSPLDPSQTGVRSAILCRSQGCQLLSCHPSSLVRSYHGSASACCACALAISPKSWWLYRLVSSLRIPSVWHSDPWEPVPLNHRADSQHSRAPSIDTQDTELRSYRSSRNCHRGKLETTGRRQARQLRPHDVRGASCSTPRILVSRHRA